MAELKLQLAAQIRLADSLGRAAVPGGLSTTGAQELAEVLRSAALQCCLYCTTLCCRCGRVWPSRRQGGSVFNTSFLFSVQID